MGDARVARRMGRSSPPRLRERQLRTREVPVYADCLATKAGLVRWQSDDVMHRRGGNHPNRPDGLGLPRVVRWPCDFRRQAP